MDSTNDEDDGSGTTDLDVVICSNSSTAVAGLSIALASAVTVCAFFALLVTALFLRKYRFHVQRLVMYLNSAILLQGISTLMSGIAVLLITLSSNESTNSALCMATAYLFNTSLGMEIILIGWITLDILLMAGFSLFTNKRMEVIQLLTATLVPLSLMWIPLLFGNYSVIDGRCDIITHDLTSCTKDSTGFYLFLLLRLLPGAVLLVVVFAMYIAVFFLLRRSSRRHCGTDYNKMNEIAKLRRKVRVLVGYPVIYMTFYLLPSLLQFTLEYALPFTEGVDANVRITSVVFVTITQSIGAVLISVALVFDKETAQRLRHCNQLSFWKNMVNARDRGETLAIPYVSMGDSLQNGSCQTSTNA